MENFLDGVENMWKKKCPCEYYGGGGEDKAAQG